MNILPLRLFALANTPKNSQNHSKQLNFIPIFTIKLKNMKQKLVIILSILLLLTVIFLISRDLFNSSVKKEQNVYEYNIDKYKQIDSSLLCYKQTGQFKTSLSVINAIAIDKNDNIYVAGNNEIQIFNKNWKAINSFKTDSIITCIATDNQQNIYIGIENHVEKFDTKGSLIKKWKSFNTKDGYITSIAINDHNVYVADAGIGFILRYDFNGNLLSTIGKKDTAKGINSYVIPSMYFDIAIGLFNDIWVVNPGKHELINYSEKGEWRSSWGKTSIEVDGFAGCCNPAHFAILPNGYFVTYEKGINRIKIYNQAGTFECMVVSDEQLKGNSEYNCSMSTTVNDIATNTEGTIYIADAVNQSIKMYIKTKN